MNPYDRDCDNYEQIRSFEQEHIPQPKMGLVRNGIRKKRDVSLRCVRRYRNYVADPCRHEQIYRWTPTRVLRHLSGMPLKARRESLCSFAGLMRPHFSIGSSSRIGGRGEGREGRTVALSLAEVSARDICDSGFKSDGVGSNTK